MAVIPFSFLPPKALLKLSNYFMGIGDSLSRLFPYLQLELDRAGIKTETKRYLAMCLAASFFIFIFLGIFLTLLLAKIGKYFLGAGIALIFTLIIFSMQINYPKLITGRRIRKLDLELLSALRAILIQLNSGVPLFEAMVIISKQEFGEVSKEFKKATNQIYAGVPQIETLEKMALQNPSPYFRRAVWQIINGLKEGAATNQVIDNVISNLTKEQIIQIEKYGSQLRPFAMFYMMGAVIMPALGITFLLVIASFVKMDEFMVKLIFWGLLGIVLFFQIIFTGIVKSKRPSLLGE